MRSQFCSKLSRLSAQVRQRAALHAHCRPDGAASNGGMPIEQQLRILEQLRRNLLSNVAHELRTPLSGILGYGELLEEELEERLNDEQRSFMHQILSEGYHLRDLINTMLDMSQLATGTLELDRQPLSLELLAQQACEQYRKLAAPKDIVFTCLIEDGLPYVHADPSRAYQVLGHLLTNALKFTPGGGRVTVRIDAVDRAARLVVADTGRGIDPAFLPHVFDRFAQEAGAPSRRPGLGLGLTLVHELVRLHGGTVVAESPGRDLGATFTVVLPVHPDALSPGA